MHNFFYKGPLVNQSFGPCPTTDAAAYNDNNNNSSAYGTSVSSGNAATNANAGSGGSSSSAPAASLAAMHAAYQTQTAPAAALNFPAAVLFMTFVINEGALITYCDDSTLSFWNLRQKQPAVLFSKKLVSKLIFFVVVTLNSLKQILFGSMSFSTNI